jgi:hypothetical protein
MYSPCCPRKPAESSVPTGTCTECRLTAIPYLACMATVAAFNHLLPSIQAVEGGSIGSIHRNLDGSDDLGVMQVNTRWLPSLARYTGLREEVVRFHLIDSPCFSIPAGGAILRVYLDETHGDLMRAIGDYHFHTPMLNQAYQVQVMRSAFRLFVNPGPESQP